MKESPLNTYTLTSDVSALRKQQWQQRCIHLIIKPGEFVKLSFISKTNILEWMWVKVESVDIEKDEYIGKLDNDPTLPMDLKCGDIIKFKRGDIADWLVG